MEVGSNEPEILKYEMDPLENLQTGPDVVHGPSTKEDDYMSPEVNIPMKEGEDDHNEYGCVKLEHLASYPEDCQG